MIDWNNHVILLGYWNHTAFSRGDIVIFDKMFKQKKIDQLINGKNYKIPLDGELVTFLNDKNAQKTSKEYEYLLNEKQSTLDHSIKDLDTDSELAKRDKVKIIEIVQ